MNLIESFERTWWARDRVLEAAEVLTVEEWTREFDFSWKSLRGLMAHVVEVEFGWVTVDILGSPEVWPTEEEQAQRFGDVAAARARSQEVTLVTRAALGELVPSRLAETRTGTDRDGKAESFTVEQILTHVYTHELRHQGQMQAIFRLLRHKAPNLDWI